MKGTIFKTTKSTDCTDIDMTLVKHIIEYIAKTLTHICNQSLQTGIVSKNIHIENRKFLSSKIISLLPQFSKIIEWPSIWS